ncbi:MAG: hypothetical protein M1836_004963 [Candelina mexicana]|nr:MAG: hypothetical protein M1836_004963 [Candelina mexicana]
MNPHQKNKIDISSLSEDEQRVFRLYGKLPTKKDLLQNKLKERKYFDSGDYALSKAGKASDVGVTQMGTQHPLPENIPHLTSPGPNNNSTNGNGNGHGHGSISQGGQAGSPVKEASFLHRETNIDDAVEEDKKPGKNEVEGSISPPPVKEGVPIRWQH